MLESANQPMSQTCATCGRQAYACRRVTVMDWTTLLQKHRVALRVENDSSSEGEWACPTCYRILKGEHNGAPG